MKYIALAAASMVFTGIAQAEQPSFSSGLAETIETDLVICSGRGARRSSLGQITAEDGSVWTVPAPVNFKNAHKAADLYNECGGTQLRSSKQINFDAFEVLDLGGSEIISAYIFADNYFELNVNGQLVAVDPVIFTPFNSNVVRFKVDRPFTLAVMGVDWEENLGLGSENNQGKSYHPGDAGFLMVLKNEAGNTITTTDGSWKAQTFYIAPLKNRKCLKVEGQKRDSSACSTTGVRDGSSSAAAHWKIPGNWQAIDFNDNQWPDATVYSNETVGVGNKRAYTNFEDIFDDKQADAQFIWSTNLILDNLVLLRKTIN
ncbi:hypothetical protein [Flexibacterium corallicola]|uniref:hypothetical protein n=1 Tax=Flexibacterium corallicola TaxID=3037259 RepID=UPI00286F84E5|nr:hypothetical protein [Pseudovibrio sp. M1P-2-3]